MNIRFVMDIIWRLFCHIHVKNMKNVTAVAMVTMITITTCVMVLQTSYLNEKGIRIEFQRQININVQLVQRQRVASEHTGIQTYGRSFYIVRFNSSQTTYDYRNRKFQIFKYNSKFQSYYNGNMTVHHTNPFSYYTAIPKKMYIISAFGRSISASRDNHTTGNGNTYAGKNGAPYIVVNGWMSLQQVNHTVMCCVLLKNKTVLATENQKRMIWGQVKNNYLMAAKMFCQLPIGVPRSEIKGVTLTHPVNNCTRNIYMEVEYPVTKASGSIAICAKIAYGTISAQRLIEWLEVQRFIGVDKVLMYFYNLNTEAMNVLTNYTKEGFVELRSFDIPLPDQFKRHVGEKKAMPFIDEQVVVYDCMERLYGYTYVGLIDVDEFIYPKIKVDSDLKRLLPLLSRREPLAAGFSFKTEVFITNQTWQKSKDNLTQSNMYEFWHDMFPNRTRPLMDRTKNILIMDRVILGSIWTHNYTAKPGFVKYNVPSSLATIKHYRKCRQNWNCFRRRGYRDKSISNLLHTIRPKVWDNFEKYLDQYQHTNVTRPTVESYLHGKAKLVFNDLTDRFKNWF